jgi:hypothetical protein
VTDFAELKNNKQHRRTNFIVFTKIPLLDLCLDLGIWLLSIRDPSVTDNFEVRHGHCPSVEGNTRRFDSVRPVDDNKLRLNCNLIPPFPWHFLQWVAKKSILKIFFSVICTSYTPPKKKKTH